MNIFKRPLFFGAIISCVGAALSLYQKQFAFIFLIASIFISIVLVFLKRKNFIIVALASTLLLVNLFVQFNKLEKINTHNHETAEGRFLVSSEIVEYDDFNMITLKTINSDIVPKNAKILIFDYQKNKLKMGNVIDAKIKLSAIDKNDEYRISNYSSGIYATANIKSLNISGNNVFYKVAGNVRTYVNKTISKYFNGDVAGLLCAVTTGDKDLISKDFSHNVKTTGISHVVVVSGMHLSIIMAAIFFIADRLFYNKYLRSLLVVLSIVFIAAICGFTMSVIRAGATFIVASFAGVFNRDNDSLNSLLTAVTIILIVDPFAVLNISFLLSLISTLAIIWVVPFYSNLLFLRFKIKSKIMQTIINLILCCIFANIFTLPISIKTFGYVSIVSLITNLCVTYFVTAALILCIVAMILCSIPFIGLLGSWLLYGAGLCASFIVFFVNKIASFPVTVAILPQSAFWISIIIVCFVILLMYFINAKLKKKEVI